MKKLLSVFLICTFLLGFAACSRHDDAAVTPSPSPVPEETEVITPAPTAEPEREPLSEAGDELVEILGSLSRDCHPGTAGSSLIAAEFAARLLDWVSVDTARLDEVSAAAEAFKSSLSEVEASSFEQQLGLVYGQLSGLLGDEAELLLESCGYKAQHFPYDADTASRLFAELYAGAGFELA